MWVSPFRYPRIVEYLLLPVAFRSLSRLSSALSAKASTLRSYQLNLLTRGAGCSPYLRPQRRTLRSWFITLASSSFDEVLLEIFQSLVPLVLDVSIFYRLDLLLYLVFKVQTWQTVNSFIYLRNRTTQCGLARCFALCFNVSPRTYE